MQALLTLNIDYLNAFATSVPHLIFIVVNRFFVRENLFS